MNDQDDHHMIILKNPLLYIYRQPVLLLLLLIFRPAVISMKSSIRCCISCILPCGALDVIRIVHSNGRVEEITGTVRAADIMKAYPKHLLKKPTSRPHYSDSNADGYGSSSNMVPRIVVVPPDAELQRGKIYFLIPISSTSAAGPTEKKSRVKKQQSAAADAAAGARKKSCRPRSTSGSNHKPAGVGGSVVEDNDLRMSSDRYLSEILSEKISTPRDRRRGRVGVWRPHLESICESASTDSAATDN